MYHTKGALPRNDLNQQRNAPVTPKEICNRSSNISWSTVSNATLTSKSASKVSCERSIAPYMSDRRRSSSLGGMALTKARLNRWDQIVGLEVRHELVSDDLFDDLGDERDIGNRSEVAWVSWIKSRTFDDGDQNRSFLVQRHDSIYDGLIANCGEEW